MFKVVGSEFGADKEAETERCRRSRWKWAGSRLSFSEHGRGLDI